jgi:hypothetical protein
MIERQGNEVRVTGAVTIANAAAVAEAGKQELNADITFDLAGVTEVDSTLSVCCSNGSAPQTKEHQGIVP